MQQCVYQCTVYNIQENLTNEIFIRAIAFKNYLFCCATFWFIFLMFISYVLNKLQKIGLICKIKFWRTEEKVIIMLLLIRYNGLSNLIWSFILMLIMQLKVENKSDKITRKANDHPYKYCLKKILGYLLSGIRCKNVDFLLQYKRKNKL